MRSAAGLLIGLLVASAGVMTVLAQRQGGATADQSPGPPIEGAGNTPYDGRVVFIRLRYDTGFGGFRMRMGPPWSHDYPRGEMHFMKIIEEITQIKPRTDGSNILSLDDPELFNYPVAYMCEPGFWTPSDKRGRELSRLHSEGRVRDLRRLPRLRLGQPAGADAPGAARVALDRARWDASDLSFVLRDRRSAVARAALRRPAAFYWGIYEDNDRSKRLVAIANVNNDISEYWEWSDTGYAPVDLSNEAYKFGVNYLVYGMTH